MNLKNLPLIVVAAGAILSTPLALAAESTIVPYGVLDAGYLYLDGAAPAGATAAQPYHGFQSGYNGVSILGADGSEDLGGGSKAFFKLETWVNMGSGQVGAPSKFWSRFSQVGLANDKLGSVAFGQCLCISQHTYKYDPFYLGGIGGATMSLYRNGRAFSNVVSLSSPAYAGANLHFYFAPSERGPEGRFMAVLANYDHGPLSATISHDSIRDGNGRLSSLYYGETSALGVRYQLD
ncbi:MAG: porin [Pseudomonadota bacterium]